MRFLDILQLSTRMFKTRPSRTALTILGVSVGIGAILFLVSLGYGMQKMIHARIVTADALLALGVTSPQPDILALDKSTAREILRIPNVEEVSPKTAIHGQIIWEDLASEVLIYGVDPSYFRLAGIMAQEGELFQKPDERKVILSSLLVKVFDIEPKQILDKQVKFTFFLPQERENENEMEEIIIIEEQTPYQISGIIEDEFTAFAYLPSETLEHLKIEKYAEIKVRVAEAEHLEKVRKELTDRGFLVSALADVLKEADRVFRIIQIVLAAFGLISLIVAAIGMANTMTVTLLERTNEIGVMKSIGASDKDVKNMFLIESMIMGFFGGIGGILLGLFIAKSLNYLVGIIARAFGGVAVDMFFTPGWFIIFIIIFSTLVGLFTGIYPARRAAKLNPLEALRYK